MITIDMKDTAVDLLLETVDPRIIASNLVDMQRENEILQEKLAAAEQSLEAWKEKAYKRKYLLNILYGRAKRVVGSIDELQDRTSDELLKILDGPG